MPPCSSAFISVRWLQYLQCALLSSLLVEALKHFAIDPQAQNLTGDLIIVRHCVALYLQFGINGQGEVCGLAVRVLSVSSRRSGLLLFRVVRVRLRLSLRRSRRFLLFVSILEHVYTGLLSPAQGEDESGSKRYRDASRRPSVIPYSWEESWREVWLSWAPQPLWGLHSNSTVSTEWLINLFKPHNTCFSSPKLKARLFCF